MTENDKKTDVMITLKSVQIINDDREETELITEGTLKHVDGGYEIQYDESEATGFEGSTTVLSCIGNTFASMQRYGSTSSNLVIEKDKKHHCHYGTPFGEFMVGVYTHKIDNKLTDSGGNVYFKYTLDVNSSYLSDNEVYISVSPRA